MTKLRFFIFCFLIHSTVVNSHAEPKKEDVWNVNFVVADHVFHELFFARMAFVKANEGEKKNIKELAIMRVFSYWVYIHEQGLVADDNQAIKSLQKNLKNLIRKFEFTDEEFRFPHGSKEKILAFDWNKGFETLLDHRLIPYFPVNKIHSLKEYDNYVANFKVWCMK
jgi:hypothetical protein